ncbi:rRNA guanine-N1-methyltransferase [Gordonia neofelifaecis NRRL B-59395]|uniref:rRNA guanine-N1-methyltransferase n=2 Tax=Gordonia TaxID=2053 RepID=F1YEQ8_9ACTN|nr:rRNA (guanine-N1)-methyltransferase [Gordonia neofelifaecis]EGD56891.1 rRNA guanine-N1-methyltransferase [Gordonia neofelifaecis NRRL B-59395]
MVAARNRIFDAGLYDPIVDAVAAACTSSGSILDAGGGPGRYLAAALSSAGDDAVGIGLDLSKFCARSAAKRHPRVLSVVADLWAGLPVLTGGVDTVLSVFAPRNVAESARALTEGGRWVIVTPEPGHLAEIVGPMHMLTVGDGKSGRLARELAADFAEISERRVRTTVRFDESALIDVAAMGPAAFHRTRDELAAAAAELAGRAAVTATLDVTITVARRR